MSNFYHVIKKPIISEKSSLQTETLGVYAFEVNPESAKQEIKQAVESLFKVKVTDVKTMIVHGKFKRTGKSVSKKANWKKAIVTLKEGHKIEFFKGV